MKQIRFSHKTYQKFLSMNLKPPFKATLLQVFPVPHVWSDLSKHFLEYDTAYIDEQTGEKKNYPLRKGTSYIFLLLQAENGLLFTTLRSWDSNKLQYYRNLEGETFQIIVPFETPKAQDY